MPCGQQAGIRSFSLNDLAVDEVADDLVLRPAADPLFAVVDGEVVLFDPTRSTSSLLNPTAALIWASIDGSTSVGDLIEDLVAETGGDRSVIDRDVRAAVARFTAEGIVDPPDRDRPDAPATTEVVGTSTSDERDRRRRRRLDAALDRMTWHGDPRARSCGGVTVAVRAGSAALAEALAPALAGFPVADGVPGAVLSVLDRGRGARRYRIVLGCETRGWAATEHQAIDLVLAELDDLVARGATGRVVLHAGAAELGGVVVVLVGPSGAGTSTLTAHLVQRGFGYVSDEVVALEPHTWSVTPHPRVIGLRDDAVDLLGLGSHRTGEPGTTRVAPTELGRVSTGGTVGLVVLLTDRPEGAADRPTSRGTALLELLASTHPCTFEVGTGPTDPLAVLAELVTTVPVVHLPRQPLDDARRAIAAHLAT